MSSGYLALVLHAHLPYVRHPEQQSAVAERWLWEALTESYIPLLQTFFRLAEEKISFRITLSLSPPLISMLGDPLLQDRYWKHLNLSLELGAKEIARNKGNSQLKKLAEFYVERLEGIKKFYDEWEHDLISAFRHLHKSGHLEVITTAATHGYLPLMVTEEARKAQIAIAIEFFEKWFGFLPKGFWLPECGYKPGIEKILAEFGIKYFIVETHGILNASPQPKDGVYAPLLTSSGVAAFGRDPDSSRQVWSSHEGYPGDFCYREFYRDIGYELDHDYLAPYLPADGVRVDTGFKYYRITGPGEEKQYYDPKLALERVKVHAGHFLFAREKQIEYLSSRLSPKKPIVVAPYDAELFGHWWFEGPLWLEELIRRIPLQQTFTLTTPFDYLKEASKEGWQLQQAEIPESSWGLGGYHEVWLGPANDWIYRHLHLAEKRMVELAKRYPDASGLQRRALNQAARELLLAQSSDWAFIMHAGTVVEYARQRVKDHLGRFTLLYHQIRNNDLDQERLEFIGWLDPIFPCLDYRVYADKIKKEAGKGLTLPRSSRGRVLMLSWEFPPRSIGGLGRHVAGLTQALAEAGEAVDVVTPWVPGTPTFSQTGLLRVHRVRVETEDKDDFLNWVFHFNTALAAYGGDLLREEPEINLIHAHDWLVAYAAVSLKQNHRIPLLVTIHATEYGRNRGIFTPLQERIHHLEWWLTYEAWRVICCSQFMKEEIRKIFQVPEDKIDVIPNGIDVERFQKKRSLPEGIRCRLAPEGEKLVFFIGRLVPEKGVQTLIEAVPQVISDFPKTRFIIGGRGPYGQELQELVRRLGVENQVIFLGYIDDHLRDQLYQEAALTVFPSFYEPFGIVALEAMAAGTPVVVSDVGGFREIVTNGVDGWRVPPGDSKALAAVIKRVLGSEELAHKVAEQGRRRALEFQWSEIALGTMEVYKRIRQEASKSDWVLRREFKRPEEATFFGLHHHQQPQPETATSQEGSGENTPDLHKGEGDEEY